MKPFEATAQDWFNYIAQGITSNALIQYVIKPNKPVDYSLLSKAVWYAVQTEPVLGCVFATDNPVPVWKPVPLEPEQICRSVTASDMASATGHFLAEGLDASTHPPVMVCLISDGKSNVIGLKIHHAVCDGSGSNYFIHLLAGIYTELEENKKYSPREGMLQRDTAAFYNALKIDDIHGFFRPEKAELPSTWGFPASKDTSVKQKFSYQLVRYNKAELQKIKQFALKHQATINTVLTAAFHLSLVKIIKPAEAEKEIQFMVDLRKYLPPANKQTICNLSAILNVELPAKENNFIAVVGQTQLAVNNMLAQDNLIHGTIACDLALESGFAAMAGYVRSDWQNIKRTGNCTPMISNLGVLDTEKIHFGQAQIDDMYLVSPAFYAPAFMLGLSTFNGVLTFCASYYSPGIQHETVKALFKGINNLLKEYVFHTRK